MWLFCWHIYASLSPNELTYCHLADTSRLLKMLFSVVISVSIPSEFFFWNCVRMDTNNLELTLNVPGDCGSARPTRVEPRLHCVGIAWQVRGKCADSAAHSPLRAITARALSAVCAIEPRPTHSARVPRTWRSAHSRAFCGPRKVRLAHCATRPKCGPMCWQFDKCNLRSSQFATLAIYGQNN